MVKFQQMLSNGKWIEISRETFDILAKFVLERETWYAPRVKRDPIITIDELIEYMERTGNSMKFDDDWYAKIRLAPAACPVPEKHEEMVKCDCGHVVPASQVMHANFGRTCPDCYDEWS